MTPTWQDVRCASIAEADLSVLADLRHDLGIRVTVAGGRAWIRWEDEPAAETTRRVLVERLLPLAGVEIFSSRGLRWHRPGESLPAFDVPVVDVGAGDRLDRMIVPEPLKIVPPRADPPRPVPLRLVRDDRRAARPASALRCGLRQLAGWADRAPSAWIGSLVGAWCVQADGDPGAAEVLVIGPASRLPFFEDAARFWGEDLLIPLGYRAEPELSERALREAVGASADELVVLDDRGPELIPRAAFEPLDRARIRLAAGRTSATPMEGGPR